MELWTRIRNRLCHPREVSVVEWRELMSRTEPLPAPRARSKFTAKGAAGVSYPEKKGKKVVAIRKRSAK